MHRSHITNMHSGNTTPVYRERKRFSFPVRFERYLVKPYTTGCSQAYSKSNLLQLANNLKIISYEHNSFYLPDEFLLGGNIYDLQRRFLLRQLRPYAK